MILLGAAAAVCGLFVTGLAGFAEVPDRVALVRGFGAGAIVGGCITALRGITVLWRAKRRSPDAPDGVP